MFEQFRAAISYVCKIALANRFSDFISWSAFCNVLLLQNEKKVA